MGRSWTNITTREIDLMVEREHDRALARYERQVDRWDAEREAYEASDEFVRDCFLEELPEAWET